MTLKAFKQLLWRMMVLLILVGSLPVTTAPTRVTVSKAAEAEEDEDDEDDEDEEEPEYTARDLKMMSCIIYCEAAVEPYAGKLAVGIVILNRVDSKKYPNTIEKVLKQRGQFTPVRTGKFSREMKKYKKGVYKKGLRAKCEKAAREVLEGRDTVKYRGKNIYMGKYLFFSQHLRHAKLRIGGHDFKVKW